MEKKKKSKIQQGMLNRYRMIFIIIALFAILIATMLFKTTVVDAPLWNEKAAATPSRPNVERFLLPTGRFCQ